MTQVQILFLLCLSAVGAGVLFWKKSRSARSELHRKQAISEFANQRAGLANLFLSVARTSGKPRGLHWKNCELSGDPVFAGDPITNELFALLGATISFEAIAGGGMEEVEAVGNLRFATAIFVFRDRIWTTDGRVVFNLDPVQTLERFAQSLARVEQNSAE